LFCQVIETLDEGDLARLEAFVASLQPHPSATEAVEKLRRLFQVLYNVAAQYIESHSQTGHYNRPDTMEIDSCLAALGFPSSNAPTGHHDNPDVGDVDRRGSGQASQRGVNPMIWTGYGMELEDWFYNNQHMMTLLGDGSFGDGPWNTGST
jgi:hypothetical protein